MRHTPKPTPSRVSEAVALTRSQSWQSARRGRRDALDQKEQNEPGDSPSRSDSEMDKNTSHLDPSPSQMSSSSMPASMNLLSANSTSVSMSTSSAPSGLTFQIDDVSDEEPTRSISDPVN